MKLCAVCCALFILAGVAGAEDVRAVAKATYSAVDRAFVARDIKAVDAAMRPRTTTDFKMISGGESLNYSGAMANFRNVFVVFGKISSSTTKIVSCKQHGASATIRVLGTLAATVKGPDGKVHRVNLVNTSEDVWKRVGGKWKCASSTTIKESTMLDGKLVTGRRPLRG
ncbi:MAG: nuclear transport factor 2 family protein [Fimbriimonadaceae bacterium]